MKALSVKQPWAERIASGQKKIENRTWHTSFRGPLLIVASKAPDEAAFAKLGIPPVTYPLGAMVCVVELWDIRGEIGAFRWHLRNPRRVVAAQVRGYAALYSVSEDLIVYR